MRNLSSQKGPAAQDGWDWPTIAASEKHAERLALLRPIPYEMSLPNPESDQNGTKVFQGRALSLNISSGGMLIIMDQTPLLDQVIKVHVPTPVALAETPTLAEVRWIRRVPFPSSGSEASFFVGLKFLFSAGR